MRYENGNRGEIGHGASVSAQVVATVVTIVGLDESSSAMNWRCDGRERTSDRIRAEPGSEPVEADRQGPGVIGRSGRWGFGRLWLGSGSGVAVLVSSAAITEARRLNDRRLRS